MDTNIVTPIDDAPMPPPPKGVDRQYVTRDLEIAAESAMRELAAHEQATHGCSGREAYVRAIERVRALVK